MKEFVGQGADAQRAFAEFEPRVDLSMGKKSLKFHWEMKKFVGHGGADAQRELAEFEPRVDLSMGRKIIEIP